VYQYYLDDSSKGIFTFKFDPKKAGNNIKVSKDRKKVFLNEKGYVFKTILGDKPMYNGYNYWEI
jgi:hypothetical protein